MQNKKQKQIPLMSSTHKENYIFLIKLKTSIGYVTELR